MVLNKKILNKFNWRDFTHAERLRQVIKATDDIIYFAESPWFLRLKLWPKQIEILNEFSRRDKYGQRVYNELWLDAGMRGSKTTIGSIIGCHETFKLLELGNPAEYYGLLPDEEIFLINVATSEPQARDTVFRKQKARIDNSPYFQTATLYEEIHNEFRFSEQNVVVRSGGSNSGSLPGRTCKSSFFDELSRFKNTSGQRSGRAVFDTLSKGVGTFGREGLVVVTSSPQYVDDPFMQLRDEAKLNPLAYVPDPIPTWELNPTPRMAFDSPYMTAKRLANPEAFWRDYGCRPYSSIKALIAENQFLMYTPNLINLDTIEPSVWPDPETEYFVYADTASRLTAYAIAMGFRRRDIAVINLLKRVAPKKNLPIDTDVQCEFLKLLGNHFKVSTFGFDVAVPPETLKKMKAANFDCIIHNLGKAEYDLMKTKFYLSQVELCELTWYVGKKKMDALSELRGLQLIENKRIDSSISKDVADAVTGVIWLMFRKDLANKKRKAPQATPLYVKRISLGA